MNRTILIFAVSALFLAACGCESDSPSASAVSDQNDKTVALSVSNRPHEDDGDVAVTLEECPAAVQATIKARLNGGSITELERTTDHGEVLYEVDVRGADGVVEFDVAEDGTFRRYENDGEEENDDDDGDDDGDDDEEEIEIPLSDVPDHVKAAAIAAVPGIVLEEAVRETEGNTVVYELEGELADGTEYEIEVTEDGAVLEIELDDEEDDDDDDDDDDDH